MFRLLKILFRLTLTLILMVGLVLAYARYIEPYWLHVEEVTISSPFVSEEADGLVIMAFADTHFSDYYTTKNFQDVLSAADEIQPDLVLFLGDLIDNYDSYTNTENEEEISTLLTKMEAPFGKYAIFGNHDYGGGAENIYENIMVGGGFQVLKNKRILVEDLNLALIGIDDVIIGYGDPTVVEEAKEDQYNLVLTHAPDVADEVLAYNADLILSGHTHGGQVNLSIFGDYVLPPYGKKYIQGLYSFDTERTTRLYVTSGIGMTFLPFRFLAPPEITVITLNRTP